MAGGRKRKCAGVDDADVLEPLDGPIAVQCFTYTHRADGVPERERLALDRLPDIRVSVRDGRAGVKLFNGLELDGMLAQDLAQLLVPVNDGSFVGLGSVEVGADRRVVPVVLGLETDLSAAFRLYQGGPCGDSTAIGGDEGHGTELDQYVRPVSWQRRKVRAVDAVEDRIRDTEGGIHETVVPAKGAAAIGGILVLSDGDLGRVVDQLVQGQDVRCHQQLDDGDGMIAQVQAHLWAVFDYGDAQLGELGSRADPRELKELGCVDGTSTDDHFVGLQGDGFAVELVAHACRGLPVEVDFGHPGVGDNLHVRPRDRANTERAARVGSGAVLCKYTGYALVKTNTVPVVHVDLLEPELRFNGFLERRFETGLATDTADFKWSNAIGRLINILGVICVEGFGVMANLEKILENRLPR